MTIKVVTSVNGHESVTDDNVIIGQMVWNSSQGIPITHASLMELVSTVHRHDHKSGNLVLMAMKVLLKTMLLLVRWSRALLRESP